MLDAGGSPLERDDEQTPLRPIYRHPQPTRPASRPPSVWVISLILVAIGGLGAWVAVRTLLDAVDHGDKEEAVAAYGLAALLCAAQFVMGVALFIGARWGRTGAMLLCLLNIAFTAVGAMTDRLTGPQLAISLGVNLVLIFALLGPKVYAWTGGDRSR